MVSGSQPICVIIAAKNASETIDIAIRSALVEPEVGEVVVIDDGSTDTTSDVAHAADDGIGQIRIVFDQQQAHRQGAGRRGKGSECYRVRRSDVWRALRRA